MAVSIPLASAAIGGVSALGGLFGGNNQPPAPPPSYQLANQAGADQGAYGGAGSLGQYNTAGQTLGQYGQIAQNAVNNPYAAGYQANANTAAGIGWGTGLNQVGAGQNLMQAGQGILPYSQQILQTGFDPQQALYNQQFQLQTDQDRAGQSVRGLAMSP